MSTLSRCLVFPCKNVLAPSWKTSGHILQCSLQNFPGLQVVVKLYAGSGGSGAQLEELLLALHERVV